MSASLTTTKARLETIIPASEVPPSISENYDNSFVKGFCQRLGYVSHPKTLEWYGLSEETLVLRLTNKVAIPLKLENGILKFRGTTSDVLSIIRRIDPTRIESSWFAIALNSKNRHVRNYIYNTSSVFNVYYSSGGFETSKVNAVLTGSKEIWPSSRVTYFRDEAAYVLKPGRFAD